MKSLIQASIVCISLASIMGCAASKVLMAGYTPPKTIADILQDQGRSPNINGIITGVSDRALDKRDSNRISLASYKGNINLDSTYDSAMTPPPQSEYMMPWVNHTIGFRPDFSYQSLQGYAAQLSMELLKNSSGLYPSDTIGVASFVMLDDSLKTYSVVGNQLAEYFISEIQQIGMPVIDFKTSNSVNVSSNGDFVFSRDGQQLARELKMSHVLSGTLIEKPNGTHINARIVSLQSKRIVSTASITVPRFITNGLTRNYVSTGSE